MGAALEQFRLIEKESAYFINSQMHIAYILDDQGRRDEAIQVLQAAVAVSPPEEKTKIYLMLASHLETKKKYRKAIEVIEEGLNVDATSVTLLFRLGVLLDKSGQKDRGLDQMRRILDIDPENADALNYIGYTYAEQGIKLNEAMDMIQKAVQLKPNNGYILDSLGWVYYQKGLYDEALEYLERAVYFTPDDPTINEHLGDVHFKRMDYRKSLELYQRAMSLDHSNQQEIEEKIERVKELLRP